LLKQLGGNYQKGADWSPFAVQDGLLITGQNPQSAQLVGEKLLKAITPTSASN
jgi:putative intracellular protease/amidase